MDGPVNNDNGGWNEATTAGRLSPPGCWQPATAAGCTREQGQGGGELLLSWWIVLMELRKGTAWKELKMNVQEADVAYFPIFQMGWKDAKWVSLSSGLNTFPRWFPLGLLNEFVSNENNG